MTPDGRWVPLPDGEVPAAGQLARVVLEGVVGSVGTKTFVYAGRSAVVDRDEPHVVSVEVWEPTEDLVEGAWHRDANGRLALRQPGPYPWMTTHGVLLADDAMVRPLAVAEWRALS